MPQLKILFPLSTGWKEKKIKLQSGLQFISELGGKAGVVLTLPEESTAPLRTSKQGLPTVKSLSALPVRAPRGGRPVLLGTSSPARKPRAAPTLKAGAHGQGKLSKSRCRSASPTRPFPLGAAHPTSTKSKTTRIWGQAPGATWSARADPERRGRSRSPLFPPSLPWPANGALPTQTAAQPL